MGALTAERATVRTEPSDALSLLVAAGVKIFNGAAVVVEAGYAKPAYVATGLLSAGVANDTIDNTAGGDGDVSVPVRRGRFLFVNDPTTPVAQTDLLTDVFWLDDQTVSADGTGRSVAGKAISLEGGLVEVEIFAA